MSTPYHAKYWAYELTRQKGGEGIDRLSQSLFDASVDLNPHQIDAALFALRSPLSNGVILADEVGLGKTIEASLVLCQLWAERKRRLLVIAPAALRKQWAYEIEEKFNLPTVVLESGSYRAALREGNPEPFAQDAVVVCSLHYAAAMAEDVARVPWDLVIIDEAHKLRNAHRASNRIGRGILRATEGRKKLLLTATPLQNSLVELYGLSLLIDDRIFGDLPSFRTQFVNQGGDLEGLRQRILPFCHRTLRRQVLEYVRYTERKALTVPFSPSEAEQALYDAVSNFLQREDTYAIPSQQRQLTSLVLRKILASSTRALASALDTVKARLVALKETSAKEQRSIAELLLGGEQIDEGMLDELMEELDDDSAPDEATAGEDAPERVDPDKLQAEIEEVQRFADMARAIQLDSKARELLKALRIGFGEMNKSGAAEKALVFTESRRTQRYLADFLAQNGYAGRLVLFNGSNTDPESRAIYDAWVEKNADTGRATGRRAVDMRTALVEHFRDEACIMIATEAGAEGVNLQFCSLVINYDLPWNPQRIEQRIGRCHRYGQRHDVVVINFLNQRNQADRRVLELLEDKFHLFSGVFGASDEVLGQVESGVDFERRVHAILESRRTPEEIDRAFEALQEEMAASIDARMRDTREKLFEHFDEKVHERLRLRLRQSRDELDRVGRLFWDLTRHVLGSRARFSDEDLSFVLEDAPGPAFPTGRYQLIQKRTPGDEEDAEGLPSGFLYRLGHPLGQWVLDAARHAPTPAAEVAFRISEHPTRAAIIQELQGQQGWLVLEHLAISGFADEEHLLFSAIRDDGTSLDQETCERLFGVAGHVRGAREVPREVEARLREEAKRHRRAVLNRALEQSNTYFHEEREKLDRWAEDVVRSAEKALDDVKAQIRALRGKARQATTLEEQHDLQVKVRELEAKKRRMREQIHETEDKVEEKRDALIDQLERRMQQRSQSESLYFLRWAVV